MNVTLRQLRVTARQTVVEIDFANAVSFLYGPVGTGKSTVARLVDYCLGGDLERTPAIQQEFVAVRLGLELGKFICTIERSDTDTQSVRVSWSRDQGDLGSINAPLVAGSAP